MAFKPDLKSVTMIEKHTDSLPTFEEDQPQSRSWKRVTFQDRVLGRVLPACILILALGLLFKSLFVCDHRYHPSKGLWGLGGSEIDHDDTYVAKQVPLEAHIMSKCPDARDCLQKLILPVMERTSDKVDFKLSYIGRLDPNSDEVYCMHGPSECLGNIIQLCAARVYPDPKIYLGFVNCMTSQYRDIPKRELIEECSLEHGIDFQTLNSCISEEGAGSDMLRHSVERSREHNVTRSCTVRLAGEVRCVRDGGEWYDCPGGSETSDLVKDINELYDKYN